MNTLRSTLGRAGIVAGALAVLVTATSCGEESGPDAGEASGDAADAVVSTRDVDDIGTILVDSAGNALYTNEAEADGTVECIDSCADFWPPLIADSDGTEPSAEGVTGTFGTVTRPDGSEQITLDGSPLYTFAEDQQPGDVTGDGFEDDFQGTQFVWHVVTVDGSAPADDSEENDGGGGGYGY